ncbi:TKL protein kinase [Phytophthora nicotianae CJ01A1]|uniref:TKL protein kinase n=3 Tax=Phytophthora nicotianae TaxID=4792 RepID=V9F5I2_PHYNI|nr:TKL protein kinase [Phytophthora nicotianae P1569]ETK86696.1 TKL protein kinase [Phytophthora nicotianae]ETL40102.1 TKL protein kinase [Phytophthora nicotianae]ETM46527.1 TKL protein kinase [Phytophthora nicotianae]ETP16576.1 TKL protein kinase [Phytophthora nicotianae CJ01A1]
MRFAGRWSFLGAAAVMASVAVRDAAADGEINVKCSGQKQAIELTLNDTFASYECLNNGSVDENIGGGSFQVNVGVVKLNLSLEAFNSHSVTSLNFKALNEPTKLVNNETLDFEKFPSLEYLTFQGVEFEAEIVQLNLPSSILSIHFIDSNLTDLSLQGSTDKLQGIELENTSVAMFPMFLYERQWTTATNIIVDLSEVNETISGYQFNTLEKNADTLSSHEWAKQYHRLCNETIYQPDGMTVSCASPNTGMTNNTYSEINSTTNAAKNDSSSSGSVDDVSAGDSSGGISTGALVAIIVVVVVIVVILAIFILRMYFKRKAANANANNNEATATLMSKGDASADKGSFISNDEFLRNFRLPQSDIALVKSQGTGRLWMGEYNGNKVMVKRVESEVTDSYVTKALMAQARTFATISHPNITSLVGVTWLAGTDFAVVTEFMDKGNLKTVLANTDVNLDIATKLQMCCDVALALAYLHETEQNLCAKQLSSRKVLVNKAMNCKLSLFECVPSSAKLGGPSTATTYSYGMGEVAWLPPEIITRSSPMDARKNNIYAFGVLVSEIFTRVSPYQSLVEALGNTMSDVELVKRVRRQDPLVPHENRQEFLAAPASVRRMVAQCLSYAPMSRPTAKELVEILHNAKEELATNSI